MSRNRGFRLVVAITDGDWFEHLRSTPKIGEVNFWAPSGAPFKALNQGELFLFKLHAPLNYIVGGGFFLYANNLPCSLAWEAFGEANGAPTFSEMRRRIARYRKVEDDRHTDFLIGCRILTKPFFLEKHEWIPAPASFASNIVAIKSYPAEEGDGKLLWEAVSDKFEERAAPIGMTDISRPHFGNPVLVRPRLGQGSFRVVVADLYERKCAITREKTLPALEAAHIVPYGQGGEHTPSNGLLLRKDLHSLFDAGYVTVAPDYRMLVSSKIKEYFENGREYYAMHGREIYVPSRRDCQPDKDALTWHNNECFLG